MTMRIVAPLALVLLSAFGAVGAAEPGSDKPAATVTARPPAQASVKPLSARQTKQRQLKCEERARTKHIEAAQRQAYLDDCLRVSSARNY